MSTTIYYIEIKFTYLYVQEAFAYLNFPFCSHSFLKIGIEIFNGNSSQIHLRYKSRICTCTLLTFKSIWVKVYMNCVFYPFPNSIIMYTTQIEIIFYTYIKTQAYITRYMYMIL